MMQQLKEEEENELGVKNGLNKKEKLFNKKEGEKIELKSQTLQISETHKYISPATFLDSGFFYYYLFGYFFFFKIYIYKKTEFEENENKKEARSNTIKFRKKKKRYRPRFNPTTKKVSILNLFENRIYL